MQFAVFHRASECAPIHSDMQAITEFKLQERASLKANQNGTIYYDWLQSAGNFQISASCYIVCAKLSGTASQ